MGARAAAGLLAICMLLGCRGKAAQPQTLASGAPQAVLAYEAVVSGNRDIYVSPAGGGTPLRLTDDPAEDSLPRWSPGGDRVLFSSERAGHSQLFTVGATGGRSRRLRSNEFVESQGDFSPDGRWLAFLSHAGGAEWLWVQELPDGPSRPLARHGSDSILGNPHWSSDGSRIVFSSSWRIGHHICLIEVGSGAEERLSPLTSGGCEPRFRPDGRAVAYVSRGHLRSTSQLVEHDLATGEERVLVDWPALNYDPVYSPDGTELAFASNITGNYQVYRRRLADGKSWRVTFHAEEARAPDYRPPEARPPVRR